MLSRPRCVTEADADNAMPSCLPLVLVIDDAAGPAMSAQPDRSGPGQPNRVPGRLVTLDGRIDPLGRWRRAGAGDVARRPLLAALHGWLAPLAPEGPARVPDTAHAAELAAAQASGQPCY